MNEKISADSNPASSSEGGISDRDTEPPEPSWRVLIANEQTTLAINHDQLQAAVRTVLAASHFRSATVSVAVVDDSTIHQLNRQFLEHDYPTDVLSFVLEDDGSTLEGELIVSSDTAAANAFEYGWSATEELLLYVVHGTLHLVGYLDKQPDDIAAMRDAEAKHLQELGISLPASFSEPRKASPDSEANRS